MRDHEFRGEISGHPKRHGIDIEMAILNTLDEYEGDNDDVFMELYIVPKDHTIGYKLMGVNIRWVESEEAWQILGYV